MLLRRPEHRGRRAESGGAEGQGREGAGPGAGVGGSDGGAASGAEGRRYQEPDRKSVV